MLGINCGSGQRRFESTGQWHWTNVDCVSRPPDQVPDMICDVGKEQLPYAAGVIDCVVLHHVLEHFGLNEGNGMLLECWRVIKPGGSLLVFCPDLKALAERWLAGGIDDYIYAVNLYGAFQGKESDRHKWGWSYDGLARHLVKALSVSPHGYLAATQFDGRRIPGANIAQDWWISGVECVKQ